MSLRTLTQNFQSPASALPTFDPANFVSVIDNPLYPLQPGTTYINASPDGVFSDNLSVTRETFEILGVNCVVVRDLAFENGELVEQTKDYFAQDKAGNVWYFGEDTETIEDGKVVDTFGTWRAGVGDQHAGIIMLASPEIGDTYQQEIAPGIAEDSAVVVSLDASVSVPYGSFGDLLQTDDSTPLEPGFVEHKLYGSGIGLLQEIANTGERLDLVKIRFDGTAEADTIDGYAGKDELYGLAGDDHLNGRGGSDIVKGGRGDDVIGGGHDQDADLLYGDQGHDKIYLRTGDKGFGGDDNDILRLLDNEDFGSVSGGDQNGSNLGKTKGDILQFEGELDLTDKGLSERITGIETISMRGRGEDELTLSACDVLDLGDGTFDRKVCGQDKFVEGGALRINGGEGDEVTLTGGKWHEIEARNAPDDYDVYARTTSAGPAYVLVQEDVEINLT